MNKVSTFHRSKNKSLIGLTSFVAVNELGVVGTHTHCKETLKSNSHQDLCTWIVDNDVNNGIVSILRLFYSSKCEKKKENEEHLYENSPNFQTFSTQQKPSGPRIHPSRNDLMSRGRIV